VRRGERISLGHELHARSEQFESGLARKPAPSAEAAPQRGRGDRALIGRGAAETARGGPVG
jgi:hypothetical protein